MAAKYAPTYQNILNQLAKGNLIHADETKGVVLGGFKGVLVSDFYAAYDSVPCPQQKCLIHLMRDINEDPNRNPFNEEFKAIACRFGALLREIVETVDRYGLKAGHLGKHRRAADGFIEHVVGLSCATEVGRAFQKRIDKNSDKLFTFLSYDGVPWNNNNAEHAVRDFTYLRNVINTSSPKGTREFATLLSIQQTLKYRGKEFLEFMKSGEMEIPG
jgi:Transposase IS66 family